MAALAALPKNPARTGAARTIAGANFRRHKRRVGRHLLRKTVLALAGLCCTSWALAQSASDAANVERMERAKRDASNPLRMIIEASSVKRAKPADAPPAAASVVTPAAARAPAEGAKAAAERRTAPRTEALAPAAEPVARPVASKSPVVEAEPAGRAASEAGVAGAAPAPPPATLATVPAATAPQEPSAAAVSAASVPMAASTAAPAAAAATAAVPAAGLAAPLASTGQVPSPPVAEVLLAPLKLVRYIEPEIPARIRGRLKPSSEVTVAFKVRPDGSVSDVGIRATSARALDPIVLDAVRQWRYDPVPSEREHVVQLVFNLSE